MRFAASRPITDFLQRKENYQDVASQSSLERAKENAMASKAEGLVAGTGMQSEADIKSAKLGAAATRYAGQQAGNAAMFGGLMSGISGIAGGAIDRFGGNALDYSDGLSGLQFDKTNPPSSYTLPGIQALPPLR